jgi:UDP-3-O-[3-hydroxymyristoyl] glucosamine N-acyltransferase
LKLQQLCDLLNLQYDSKKDIDITGLNTLQDASNTEVSFLQNKKYLSELKSTHAAAVFVTKENSALVPEGSIALISDNPYVSLAYASKVFAPLVIEEDGEEAIVKENTIIQENVYLGKNTKIGKNSILMSGTYIGDNVTIGDNCIVYPNVSVYRDCQIGNDTILHSGVIIGADGFGFATDEKGKHIKIYQNGNVLIGNSVEIGANTTIDRAAFASTIIEDMVRIDNLVQIAHNCKIEYGSVITAQCGVAGSTTMGKYCVVGAQTGIAGHIEIAPFSTIYAKSGVSKSIKHPNKHWAGFPLNEHKVWLKLQAKIQKLCFPEKLLKG